MTNSAASTPPALRDIKAAVEILDLPRLIVISILALCLAVGIYFLIKWLLRKKVFSPVSLSPRQKALELLKDAEKLLDQPVEFVIFCSSVLRTFFEEEHGLNAPDRTTEEFLVELSRRSSLEATQPVLVRFLDQTDLVKFARFEPTRAELDALLSTAREVIAAEPLAVKKEGEA